MVPETSWRWRFGDPSLHRFWQIPCDRRTDERTDRWTELRWRDALPT